MLADLFTATHEVTFVGSLMIACKVVNCISVTFVDLLLFSSFSEIPGAFRIKTCDKSHIKIFFEEKKSSCVKYICNKNMVKSH